MKNSKAKGNGRKKNPHIGSSLDAFLKEEGIFEQTEAQAVREVMDWQRRKSCAKPGNNQKRNTKSA